MRSRTSRRASSTTAAIAPNTGLATFLLNRNARLLLLACSCGSLSFILVPTVHHIVHFASRIAPVSLPLLHIRNFLILSRNNGLT